MMSLMMGGANYGVGGTTVMTSSQPLSITSPQGEIMTSDGSPDPPSPAHSDSSHSNFPHSPPHQRGIPKECGVCADVAKSMHFGGLSCDSCKAFFRRSVQNNAYRGFSCPYERNCAIGVSSRKACQYCRFEKCLMIGMEKGWVMSEDERRKMMEQRKERKTKMMHDTSQHKHIEAERTALYSLSEEDRDEIAHIVTLYKKAYTTIPYDEVPSVPECSGQGASSSLQVLGPWMTFCKRIAYFFSLFGDFAELSTGDQSLLLKTAITSAGIIMGSVVYDSSNGRWAAKLSSRRGNVPSISSQNVEKVVPSDLMHRVDQFFKKFQQVCPDETMAMILILISLYTPELTGLEAKDRVQSLQERYIHILQNYVKFKFREKSVIMFPKAIVSLADIRELADRTCQMKIRQDRASSMIPNLLNPSLHLGSPYPDITNVTYPPVKTEMNEIVPVSGSRSDICNPLYKRILNVICQMHHSPTSSQQPTLLPFIIQILKKLAQAHYEGKTSRSISGCGTSPSSSSSSSSSRRSYRHSRTKTHRHRSSHHRKKLVELKREERMEQLMCEDPGLVVVKEEMMDHMDEPSLTCPVNSPTTIYSDPYGGGCSSVSSDEFVDTFSQVQQFQLSPSHQSTSPPLSLDQSPLTHQDSLAIQQQSMYHHSNYSQTNPTHSHTQSIHAQHAVHQPDLISSQLPFGADESSMSITTSQGYPLPMSPDGFQHLPHPPIAHSPEVEPISPPMSHTPNIQVGENLQMASISPYSPQQHIATCVSPTTPLTPGTAAPLLEPSPASLSVYQQDNPCVQVLSPYSSSSSSSSPEDSEGTRTDIFSDNLTQTEVDVLMQVMERVVNIDSMNPAASIRDVLPLQLLNELQNKLCSLNSEDLTSSGISLPGSFLSSNDLETAGLAGAPLDSDADVMEMEVDNWNGNTGFGA